jgi:probable rRNA maturation factor
MTEILVEAESPLWEPVERWMPVVRSAAAAALEQAWPWSLCLRARSELSVLLTDDDSIRRLNRDWRGKDKATNVLAFPMLAAGELPSATSALLLGDVVLARETLEREAEEASIAVADHVSHLAVHGVLHLLGHDHQADADAERMEALEARILHTLGIADPYGRQRQAA